LFVSDKPSAPKNLRVTGVNKDSVSLAWDEPDQDGGAPVKRYVVEKADVKRGVFSEAGDTQPDKRQLKVSKLLEGNDYMFRVAAENEIGQGKPASLAEPVTARLPFGELKVKRPISELRGITCHMGSNNVTCHPTQANTPRHNPSQ